MARPTFPNFPLVAVALVLIFTATTVWGYSGGAPCQAQHTLQPNELYHGAGIKTVSPPYKFTVLGRRGRQIKRYRPGKTYTVKLHGGAHFRGFLVQARLATKKGEMIGHLRTGKFVEEQRNWTAQGIKIQRCPPVFSNSITHSNNDKKYGIRAKWTIEEDVGPIQFYITIVQEKTVFWAKWTPKSGFLLPISHKRGIPKSGSKQQSRKSREESEEEDDDEETEVLAPPPRISSGRLPTLERPKSSSIIERNDLRRLSQRLFGQPEQRITGHSGGVRRRTEKPSRASAPKILDSAQKQPTKAPSKTNKEEDTFGLRRLAQLEKENVAIIKRKDFCESDPCFNRGTCVNLEDEEGFVCFCKDQYSGKLCETRNHCYRNECVYGTCINEADGYKCECHNEYLGVHCERHCPSYLCENGGTCYIDETGNYGCNCTEGWTGEQCQKSVDDCANHICLNGAECVDEHSGYSCKCKEGFMGPFCHRPCQNIYKSCETWEAENRCEAMRAITKFFDINCAATCGLCAIDNETIFTDIPIPPILEPFSFLMGDWVSNYSGYHRYPIDFDPLSTSSYLDTISFRVAEVPMFGTPSINFTATAASNDDPSDMMQNRGFLTLNTRSLPGEPLDIALVSTGSDGVTIIEEGKLDRTELNLKVAYSSMLPQVEGFMFETLERTLVLRTPYLRETVTKTKQNGNKQYYTKYYYQQSQLRVI